MRNLKCGIALCCMTVGIIAILVAAHAEARDQIPYRQFIQYTATCLDITDKMEIEYSKTDISSDAVKYLDYKYNLCMKKIERYGYDDYSKKSQQLAIRGQLNNINVLSDLMMSQLAFGEASRELYDILLSDSNRDEENINKMKDCLDNIMKSRVDLRSSATDIINATKTLNSLFIAYKDSTEKTITKKRH